MNQRYQKVIIWKRPRPMLINNIFRQIKHIVDIIIDYNEMQLFFHSIYEHLILIGRNGKYLIFSSCFETAIIMMSLGD